MFPIKQQYYLEAIAEGDVVDTFNKAVGNTLNINPSMRDSLLQYMIHIVMSDKKIVEEEVRLLYGFGGSIGFSEMEIAQAIADSIQKSYVPSLESIC